MQNSMRLLAFLSFSLLITVSSCKKDDVPPTNEPDPATDHLAIHTQDQARVSEDMDAITNEINVAVEGNTFFSGKQQQTNVICGATTTVDTSGATKSITITYNGNNCANTHHRQGTVVLSMPSNVQWKQAGAVITVSYNNLTIKKLSNNKSITISGSHQFTNVSGGLMYQLPTMNEIIHTISSNNMVISFNDSTQRTWNVARKRTYTYNNGIKASITGTHTINNMNGVAEWGTDRFGHPFVSAITQPLVIKQDCNFRLTGGEIKHKRLNTEAVVTFGLNANGQPTGCPGAAPYYYKLVWTGPNNNTHTVIHPY